MSEGKELVQRIDAYIQGLKATVAALRSEVLRLKRKVEGYQTRCERLEKENERLGKPVRENEAEKDREHYERICSQCKEIAALDGMEFRAENEHLKEKAQEWHDLLVVARGPDGVDPCEIDTVIASIREEIR